MGLHVLTIRGSLMKPKWQKLASLAQEKMHTLVSVLWWCLCFQKIPFKNIFDFTTAGD